MFNKRMFNKRMFNKPYVQQTLCSTNPCSAKPMFNKPYVQQTHVQQTLCSTNPMFNKSYVQQTLHGINPTYCAFCSQCSLAWRRVFPRLVKQLLGEHPGTPAGLVTRTLYVPHRSRAFHEVWCPKVIGRDSWVREATGVSVQRIPPKNWGKKLVVVCKRVAP